MSKDCDIIILGSGSTAFAAALRAQALGSRVTMIEKSTPGGTCINWGCIPSKTLIHAALFRQEARLGEALGVGTMPDVVDWERLAKHKNRVVKGLRKSRYLDVLQAIPDLQLIKGTGHFIGPRTVAVGDQVLTSERILVATGGFPLLLDLPGLNNVNYLTSRSALLLKKFPSSLIIIGGGVIAVEMGQMLTRMGATVQVLEHGKRILSRMEFEPVQAVQKALQKEGMKFMLDVKVLGISQSGNAVEVVVESNGQRKTFRAEKLLLAAGTAPSSRGIGLEKVGVAVNDRGYITVDDQMRTTAPDIWAAGDVTGGMMIATVGAREGIVAV
ncbi:MAG: NAD(P)/FAD-dependent oxidoreductase, partial [Geobacter sp.]